MKTPLVIITNLYPLPWQPTRATFNYQQFTLLNEHYDVHVLIPVAFLDWWKHIKQIKQQNTKLKIVPYVYIPKFGRRFYSTLMYFSLRVTAWQWLKRIAPTKILASWAYPDGVAAEKIAKKFNADFFLKVHGSDINMHASFPARANQIAKMANQANGILSVSQDLANKMVDIGIQKDKISVIYNGVNLDKFTPSLKNDSSDKPYILFIGNLKKEKGVMELLQAFKIISKTHPTVMLSYIGGGAMLAELKNTAESLSIVDKVIFKGVLAHDMLPSILANAILLALPSYNEGVPNVVLESMACGVPVVATRVGGIPEVVTENTGYLANEITPEAIAKSLEMALDKQWNVNEIRQHAEQFNWSKNITELCDLLSMK